MGQHPGTGQSSILSTCYVLEVILERDKTWYRLNMLVCLSIALLQQVQKPKPAELPFAAEIAQFEAMDKKNPPARGQILFTGSSSFTKWTDVQDYFPGTKILNRAFGGSSLPDMIRYVDKAIVPYRPKQIVIYCGENDFAGDAKLPAYKVEQRFETLFKLIRAELPTVPIVYVSMKPSPSRWYMRAKFVAGNRWIEEFCQHQPNCKFVSVWDQMLDENGRPKAEIFLSDRLHMNAKGYHIWQPIIAPYLLKG